MNINRVEVKTHSGVVVFRNRMALGFLVWYEREHLDNQYGGVKRDEIVSVKQGLYAIP